jgi:hypothetical protein
MRSSGGTGSTEIADTASAAELLRVVNNLNINYKPRHDLQIVLQYACKYVLETMTILTTAAIPTLSGFRVYAILPENGTSV